MSVGKTEKVINVDILTMMKKKTRSRKEYLLAFSIYSTCLQVRKWN